MKVINNSTFLKFDTAQLLLLQNFRTEKREREVEREGVGGRGGEEGTKLQETEGRVEARVGVVQLHTKIIHKDTRTRKKKGGGERN